MVQGDKGLLRNIIEMKERGQKRQAKYSGKMYKSYGKILNEVLFDEMAFHPMFGVTLVC